MLDRHLQHGSAFVRVAPGEPPERGDGLTFTGVINIYHEDRFMPEEPNEIKAAFEKSGIKHVRLYGPDYQILQNSDSVKSLNRGARQRI